MGLRDGGTTSPALLKRLVDWRDDAAWREIFEQYRPLIQVWCRRMRLDADTTEELCQRIWIKLAHRMSSFQYDPSRKFRGWLRRVCHSRAVELFRERRADPIRLLADEPLNTSGQFVEAGAVDEDEDREPASRRPELLRLGARVHDSVKCRGEPQTWEAFWSVAVEGRTIRETADILKMSYAAA